MTHQIPMPGGRTKFYIDEPHLGNMFDRIEEVKRTWARGEVTLLAQQLFGVPVFEERQQRPPSKRLYEYFVIMESEEDFIKFVLSL